MPPVQSTLTSGVSKAADGHGTNTLAEESKVKAPVQPRTTQHGSSTKWKAAGDLESSSTSTMNDEPNSLSWAEPESAKRKIEMEGYLEAQKEMEAKKKKVRKKAPTPTPNATHMKLRAAVDAVDNWELDLENKHGLSDLEACVCVGLVAKHQNRNAFTDDSEPGVNKPFVDFVRKGWQLMKELDKLLKKYPQEAGEQTKINGAWKMILGEPTLEEVRAERERKLVLPKSK